MLNKNDTLFIKDEKGLTLIEVMTALIIVSIGILAVLGMQTTAIKSNYQSNFFVNAEMFARQRMETILSGATNIDPTTLEITEELDKDGSVLNKGTGTYQRATTIADITDNLAKAVNVQVSWTTGGRNHSINFCNIKKFE